MTSTLQLAMEKAARLPEAAQEQIGLELLERLAAFEALRADIEIGIRELDAGLGVEIDFEDLIRELHEKYAPS